MSVKSESERRALPWHDPEALPRFEGDDTHCRHPRCRETNWGGYDRVHLRSDDCPPIAAASQRPAADAERADQLSLGRERAATMRTRHALPGGDAMLVALDDEVARLTALLTEHAAAIERTLVAVSGIGAHIGDCRVPDAACTCRTAEIRIEARAAVLTALGSQQTEGQR